MDQKYNCYVVCKFPICARQLCFFFHMNISMVVLNDQNIIFESCILHNMYLEIILKIKNLHLVRLLVICYYCQYYILHLRGYILIFLCCISLAFLQICPKKFIDVIFNNFMFKINLFTCVCKFWEIPPIPFYRNVFTHVQRSLTKLSQNFHNHIKMNVTCHIY